MGGEKKRLSDAESIPEKWEEMDMMREKKRQRERERESAATLSAVRWQSAPPEATAVINAVIEWTHIFISYWFISNSPLILGGHHHTVAFLLPRLRFSAPPAITVVITAPPPRKLFTVSYRWNKKKKYSRGNKKANEREEQEEGRERGKKKKQTEREQSKAARLSPTGVRFDKTELQWALNNCCCVIPALIVKELNLLKAQGMCCSLGCFTRQKLCSFSFLLEQTFTCSQRERSGNIKHWPLRGWLDIEGSHL